MLGKEDANAKFPGQLQTEEVQSEEGRVPGPVRTAGWASAAQERATGAAAPGREAQGPPGNSWALG